MTDELSAVISGPELPDALVAVGSSLGEDFIGSVNVDDTIENIASMAFVVTEAFTLEPSPDPTSSDGAGGGGSGGTSFVGSSGFVVAVAVGVVVTAVGLALGLRRWKRAVGFGSSR